MGARSIATFEDDVTIGGNQYGWHERLIMSCVHPPLEQKYRDIEQKQ